IRLRGRLEPGVNGQIAGLVDIPATILDVLARCGGRSRKLRAAFSSGGNARDGGSNVVRFGSGMSLLGSGGESSGCYAESFYGFYAYHWAPLYSLIKGSLKYIDAPIPHLYNLDADPEEKTNLAPSHPELSTALKRQLVQLRDGLRRRESRKVRLDAQAIARLRSLGYLSGRSAPVDVSESGLALLRDPHSVVRTVHGLVTQAREYGEKGLYAEMVPLLTMAVQRSPESPEIHEMLATAHLHLGMSSNALPHIHAVLDANPENRTMVANLGSVYLENRDYEKAVMLYQQALSLPHDPREPLTETGVSVVLLNTRACLATALESLNRVTEAEEQYRLILAEVPDHLEARNGLANLCVRQQRFDEAIEQFRACLRINPRLVSQRENLGRLLWHKNRYKEALDTWREGLRFYPEEPVYLFHLAWRLATCPDDSVRDGTQAVGYAETLCRVTEWSNVQALDCLAAAYAESGKFDAALATLEKAIALAKNSQEAGPMIPEIRSRLELYQRSQPFRDKSSAP
ncbi:MAG: tetratricopeptide repeat protein, partial [Kiritimatiellae bacterium]|nr:tetratricopeptide repeat protein [Kiritimatiellia bacterium]